MDDTTRLHQVLLPQLPEGARRYFLADHCANCLELLPETTSTLFCGQQCQQSAKATRYYRKKRAEGIADRADIRRALRTKMAFVLVGGYDETARRLPGGVRRQVQHRDNDRCVTCGAPGEQVDHIDGNSPALDNLQLLCQPCHETKTGLRMRPAPPDITGLLIRWEALRGGATEPLLLADDEVSWGLVWRKLARERRARLNPDRAEFWSRFEAVDDAASETAWGDNN